MANNILSFEFCDAVKKECTYRINNTVYTATTTPFSVDIKDLNISSVSSLKRMLYQGLDTVNPITKVNQIVDSSNCTDLSQMFAGCRYLNNINAEAINTSKCINMDEMFRGCMKIESLDLSSFDAQNVNSMNNMLGFCVSLKTLNLSNLKSKSVNVGSMFSSCHSLTDLNIKGWKPTVSGLYKTFDRCYSLKSLDLSEWNAKNVSTINGAFNSCHSLKFLNLSGWNLSPSCTWESSFVDLANLDYVIMNDCTCDTIEKIYTAILNKQSAPYRKLIVPLIFTNIDCPYAINTTKPNLAFEFSGNNFNYMINTDTYVADKSPFSDNIIKTHMIRRPMLNFDYMFKSEGNNQFISFSVLPDSSELRTMTGMFLNSEKVTNLDLSMINVSKVYNVEKLVRGCTSLETLDLSNWDLLDTCKTTDMFKGCTSLRTIILKNSSSLKKIEDALVQSGIPTGQVTIVTQ